MTINRRSVLQGLGGVAAGSMLTRAALATVPGGPVPVLPDRSSFSVAGTHLNAAYTHPLGRFAVAAGDAYAHARATDGARNWPVSNARDEAVAHYAALIGAQPQDIAVVPSTLEGENLLGDALGLGPGAGVVTDALHYDAALVWYAERARRGMPLTVIAPRDGRFDYDEFAAAITPETKLVAISLVTSLTGYRHDLKRLCDIAHDRGALVYADVIQAVGAIPFDVKDSGVDFCCAGTYKWLMGDFGTAFLYVKPGLLPRLRRVQFGWRGLAEYRTHVLPGDPPGPPEGDWRMLDTTAGVFEVSTPNWGGLAVAAGALAYINAIGAGAIAQHRTPLLALLRDGMERAGFQSLTPVENEGPALVFGMPGLKARFGERLRQARIFTTVYKDRIRISPSVHNTTDDIEHFLKVMT